MNYDNKGFLFFIDGYNKISIIGLRLYEYLIIMRLIRA
jgi:hypothetical protein